MTVFFLVQKCANVDFWNREEKIVDCEKIEMYRIIQKLWFGHKAQHESTKETLELLMDLSTLLMEAYFKPLHLWGSSFDFFHLINIA